jgi:hypothetical protein
MTLEDFEINGLSAFKDSQKKENVLSGFRKSIESGSHLMPCALIVDDTKWITGQDFRVIFQEFTELIRLNVELHTTHDRMVYRAKDFDVFGLVLNIGRVLGRNELSQAMSMRRRKGLK